MAYLLAQMWTLLVLAGAISLGLGLAAGALLARRRVTALVADVDRARHETDSYRQQAARLSAMVESQSVQARTAQPAADPRQVAELEAAVRAARSAADREAAHAEELRARVSALETAAAAVDTRTEPESNPEALAAAEAEVTRLREELDLARAARALVGERDQEDQARAAELEEARARVAELEPAVAALASLRRETATWEAEREDLVAAARRLAAIEAGDRAAYAEDAPARAPHWLSARNQWLEYKLADVQGHAVAEPNEVEAEMIALRARVAELESLAFAYAPQNQATMESTAEIERLRWRNQYLTSRVTYLEGKSEEAQDAPRILENERLRARVAELEAAAATDLSDEVARLRARLAERDAGTVAPQGGDDNTVLSWRNRYLTSRVDYLERRLSDFESADIAPQSAEEPEAASLRAQVAGLQAQAEEASRLRARLAEVDAAGRGESADGDSTLQWRNRYLNSRVKYLEDQVAALRRAADPADGSSSESA